MLPAMKETRLVVLVTEADSICGFTIAQHLLHKLSGISLSEAGNKPTFPWFPEFSTSTASPFNPAGTYPAVDALTLILACRREAKADETRTRLLKEFEKLLVARDGRSPRSQRMAGSQQFSFTAMFAQRLKIDVVELDTISSSKLSAFCDYAKDRYSYLSHIIFVNTRESSDINNCTSTYYTLTPLLQACPILPSRVLWVDDSDDAVNVQVTSAVASYLDVQAGQGVRTNQSLSEKQKPASTKKLINRVRHFAVHSESKDIGASSLCALANSKSVTGSTSYLGKLFSPTTSQSTASAAVRLALLPFLLLPSPPPGDPAMAASRSSIESIMNAMSTAGSTFMSEKTKNRESAWIVGAR